MNYETIYPDISELLIHSGNHFGVGWHMFFTKEELKTGLVTIYGVDRTYTGCLMFMKKVADTNSYTMANAVVKIFDKNHEEKAADPGIYHQAFRFVDCEIVVSIRCKDASVEYLKQRLNEALPFDYFVSKSILKP